MIKEDQLSKKLIRYLPTLLVLVTQLCAAIPSPLAARQSADEYPESNLSLTEVSENLRFLASDDLQGRKSGEPGNEAAARFIAEHFRAYGLRNVPGISDYFQSVPLRVSSQSQQNWMTISGDTLRYGGDLIVLNATPLNADAQLLQVEFGIDDTSSAGNDYAQLDARGKVVVANFGTHEGQDLRAGLQAGNEKLALARKKGALALVELYDGQVPWERLAAFLQRPRHTVATAAENEPDEPTVPHLLINNSGGKYDGKINQSNSTGLFIQEQMTETITSPNVVGLIEGGHADLKESYVVLMAHFDHIGTNHGPADEDNINNGARDNGMGVVALLSAAKTLSSARPARSVICLATTAEEMGLLGSKYYTENPLVPLNKTIFVLNTDGAGFTDTSIVSVVGLDRTGAKQEISRGAAAFGLDAISDPVPHMNLFSRSDNINFARKGIPAPTFSPGFRTFGPELQKYYHQPQDEVGADFDFNYLLKFSKAFAYSARLIADMPAAPQWRYGDEFEPVSKELYSK